MRSVKSVLTVVKFNLANVKLNLADIKLNLVVVKFNPADSESRTLRDNTSRLQKNLAVPMKTCNFA